MIELDPPKVVVRRGEARDEYPIPLPMMPTFREMNLMKRVTGLTFAEIIAGAGEDPDADFAVALYAIKRENPMFGLDDAEALFDLPGDAIEIHFGAPEEEPDADPLSGSGSSSAASDMSSVEPPSSESSTTEEIPEEPGIQP